MPTIISFTVAVLILAILSHVKPLTGESRQTLIQIGFNFSYNKRSTLPPQHMDMNMFVYAGAVLSRQQ